jgi:hypothetical protein
MLAENARDFFDGFGVSLRRMRGTHDFLGLDSFDVCAFVRHHAVGLAGYRAGLTLKTIVPPYRIAAGRRNRRLAGRALREKLYQLTRRALE